MKPKRSMKPRDNGRRMKKKTSVLITERVEYIDWKDVNLLRRFMSDRAKIRARRVSGNDTQQQRQVAGAIKIAREMALLPYTSRVTTQRGGGGRGRDGDGDGRRRNRDDAPEVTEEFGALDEGDVAEGAVDDAAEEMETAEVEA